MSKTQMQQAIEAHLEHHGLTMRKQISSGGLFTNPTYDNRTVYSVRDLNKLNSEGFLASQNLGDFVFNALMRYEDKSKRRKGDKPK